MHVTKFQLKNWKNFENVEVKLGSRVFVIGPNASGKSNLLDAFRFLRDVANDGLEKAVNDIRGGVSAIRCLAARRYSDIEFGIFLRENENTTWQYQLSISQDNLQRPVVKNETILKDKDKILLRPNEYDEKDSLRLTQTALEQVAENREFRRVVDFLKTISFHHLIPQVVRDPRGFSPLPVQNDPFGRDFLLRMWKTTQKIRDSRLKKITAALRSAVPQLSDLQVNMDQNTGVPHLIGGYSHWRKHNAKQNESQFSDGTLRLLGLLWTVYEGSGILLLEEPEISLHPEVVRRLPTIFYRINRSRKEPRQLIISTHSEEMLSDKSIAPEEVLRLEPGPNGTKICPPDEAEHSAMAAGLSAADVLMPKAAPDNIQQMVLEF